MKKWIPVLAVVVAVLTSDVALAQDAIVGPNAWRSTFGLAAGLAMGLAALGGTIAQGMAARGMYESVSRNPNAAGKLNTPFFVGMAFIESLVLFTFAIAYLLLNVGA